MLLLVPHLFVCAPLLDVATHGLRLPALETLLAQGSRRPFCDQGLEAALCQALGVARQQDWPLAPITLQADGGHPGTDYWLRADPVHLQVMRDRIVLGDRQTLVLDQAEADALADAIAAHFGSAFSPQALRPRRWYLRLAEPPQLATTPLSVAAGRDIDPLLPRGRDALRYRAVLNELQMLLHDHPVNQSREARGQLPVNSLWLWGGGTLPGVAPRAPRLAADEAEARMLGQFVGAAPLPLAAAFEREAADVAVLDTLATAAESGDAFGWREAARTVEVRIEALLRSGRRFTLADPLRGTACTWRGLNRLKLWRRRLPLASALAQA